MISPLALESWNDALRCELCFLWPTACISCYYMVVITNASLPWCLHHARTGSGFWRFCVWFWGVYQNGWVRPLGLTRIWNTAFSACLSLSVGQVASVEDWWDKFLATSGRGCRPRVACSSKGHLYLSSLVFLINYSRTLPASSQILMRVK